MSSSISTEYSPLSNYSYPTDLTLSPLSPAETPRALIDQAAPPRLSSPHIFRDFFANESAGPSNRLPPRLPPLHEINFAETMQDVNRALQSANRAIQTAQEAFQSRRTDSANNARGQDVVDLTDSPPSPNVVELSFDSFLTDTLHPLDSQSSSRMPNRSLNEPVYPITRSANASSLFIPEDDPTSRYAGQSDSLAGARRRHEAQRRDSRRVYTNLPSDRMFFRSGGIDQRRDEEDAIHRQRVARQTWQQNQQRQQERDQQQNRLEQQRDRLMSRTEQHLDRVRAHVQNQMPSAPTRNDASTSVQLSPRRRTARSSSVASSSPPSSVEAVDLTTTNNNTDLAAALLNAQSNNTTADPTATSEQPRSALTGYKCPICLEPPRNATTTICGHLFCHECILETLKNSENIRREDAPPHRKVKGQCPVCRKELARQEEGVKRTLVPLEIKLISKKKLEELRRLEKKKRHREWGTSNKEKNNGKGKEVVGKDGKGDDDYRLSSDDEVGFGDGHGSQMENRTKRLKLSQSEELDEELFGAFINGDQA